MLLSLKAKAQARASIRSHLRCVNGGQVGLVWVETLAACGKYRICVSLCQRAAEIVLMLLSAETAHVLPRGLGGLLIFKKVIRNAVALRLNL